MTDVSTSDLIIIIALFVFLPFIALAIYPALFIILRHVPSPTSFYKAIYNPTSNLLDRIKTFFIMKQNSRQTEIENKVLINSKELPPNILKMLNLSSYEEVLFVCRIFPFIKLLKEGKKKFSTLLLITNKYIYLISCLACRNKYEDIDKIPLNNILSVESMTKEGTFFKKPFISIKTKDNIQYNFLFPPLKISNSIIYKFLSTFKIATNEIKVTFNLPEDLRSDAFKEYQEGIKDLNKQMKEEWSKDLNNIFK